jgi:hypothetical protein
MGSTATKSKKMMSDLNFNQIPSEIKYFIHGKETVNDIPNLFGSLQKMKIPQVQSDIDFEVVNSYTTDLSDISNIITVDDKSTWVNNCKKQVIRQINVDNDNITTTKQISCFIYDMTLVTFILKCPVYVHLKPPPTLQPPPSQYDLMSCQQQLCLCYNLLRYVVVK